jgi:hypothetical protein
MMTKIYLLFKVITHIQSQRKPHIYRRVHRTKIHKFLIVYLYSHIEYVFHVFSLLNRV